MWVTRRHLMLSAAAVPASRSGRRAVRPRVAVLCTTFAKHSHTQHIVDRLLDGYGWQGQHHRPSIDVASLYVEQTGGEDLTAERLRRHPGVRVFPTIGQALTLDSDTLDVDGVLIVAEQGRYPHNDRGQTLYPRFEFFQETLRILRRAGRTIPIWNNNHLSWSWERAREMYDDAMAMDVPLMAGSFVPLVARLPAVDLPYGAEVKDALCVGYGDPDSYDIHGVEGLLSMVERRRNGESGVRWVQTYRGDAFWNALDDGIWPDDLMTAALCRSLTLGVPPVAQDGERDYSHFQRVVKDPIAYQFQHNDGLRSTLLLMNGLVRDFTFAGRVGPHRELLSTLFYWPTPPEHASLANFFSPLVNQIESFIQTARSPFPIERTLLSTGLVAEAIESLHRQGQRIETPHLGEIRYTTGRTSQFWRA